MNKNKKNTLFGYIQIIVLSAYPVVSLYAININEISIWNGFRSLTYSIIFSIIIYQILTLVLKSQTKSNIYTSFIILGFYFYGHIHSYINSFSYFIHNIGRHIFLFPLWGIIIIALFFAIKKKNQPKIEFSSFLQIFSLILLSFPISIIIEHQNNKTIYVPYEFTNTIVNPNKLDLINRPDIYYIILDGYIRDDYLLDVYGYDNTNFLNSLQEIGFFIGKCSQSNYAQSKLSITSSLNMDYIDTFYDPQIEGYTNKSGNIINYLANSRVFGYVERIGYQTVTFETKYEFADIKNSDTFIYRGTSASTNLFSKPINSFEVLLLEKSYLSPFYLFNSDFLQKLLPSLVSDTHSRGQVLAYNLDYLENDVHYLQSPKFVYAHIISPHEPYNYNQAENENNLIFNYDSDYANQVHYLNSKILAIVNNIIENSETEPIIIIQGDHGTTTGEIETDIKSRMAILNVYYGPSSVMTNLYESISPVNSFRVIFNQLFDEQFELLPDISRFSIYEDPQNYTISENKREGCK